jgi:hypothetical protein
MPLFDFYDPERREVYRKLASKMKKDQLIDEFVRTNMLVEWAEVEYKQLEKEYDSLHSYKNELRDKLRKIIYAEADKNRKK